VTVRVLVLGSGRDMLAERDKALALFNPDRVYAVNDAGIYAPGRVDVWVSIHAEDFPRRLKERRDRGGNRPPRIVSCPAPGIYQSVNEFRAVRWPEQRNTGSSGLFATKVALEDGATHVVLAGMPMHPAGGHIVVPGPWDGGTYQKTWFGVRHRLKRVRSMSGWTAFLLGWPNTDWLASPADASDERGATGPDGPAEDGRMPATP
jgi:hypothetical protein